MHVSPLNKLIEPSQDLIRKQLNISNTQKANKEDQTVSRPSCMADFVVMSKLGDGAYSKVFKVKRLADGSFYAMKKVNIGSMSSKDRENAINEVRILASINHPNVISYKEAFVDSES
jgi:serine/threonine protein kinase